MIAELEGIVRKYFGIVSTEEQKGIFQEISTGSHPSPEYFVMLVISAIIATIGLLTNSVAAIIGAMLVSPLLMPVIGISLGAVKGDLRLFKSAMEAEAKGIIIVLVLVVLFTLMVPNASATSEIILRTHPTPLDLIVALASGAAAAYAISKKNIGATLPGVAIAVAIMPPLCVTGIGFALKMPTVALGGALMFAANVVAINMAAIVVFWLVGFAPSYSLTAEKQAMAKMKTSLMLLLVISVPLAWIMWESISSANTGATVERALSAQLDGIEQAKLVSFEFKHNGGTIVVSATIDSPKQIDGDKADEMRIALEKNLGSPVDLYLSVNEVTLVKSLHN